jgi:hypothetical protein
VANGVNLALEAFLLEEPQGPHPDLILDTDKSTVPSVHVSSGNSQQVLSKLLVIKFGCRFDLEPSAGSE